jgi:hypothetical protein
VRKAKVLSILYVVVLLAVSITAEAQQPKKIYRIGYLSSGIAASESTLPRPFGWLCARLAISKDRTSQSSSDMQRESVIDSLNSRPSWCALKLLSSWQQEESR